MLYTAYVTNGRGFPMFYSLPSADRHAAIANCFDAFPHVRTVTSTEFCDGENGKIRGAHGFDIRWHDRYYFRREA